MKKIACSFILLLVVNLSYSQSTPFNDPAGWVLDFQDDFNYSNAAAFIAGNKWLTTDYRADVCPGGASGTDDMFSALHYGPSAGSGNYVFSSGTQPYLLDAGMLSLVVKSISPTPLNGIGTYGQDGYGTNCTRNFIYSTPNQIKTEGRKQWKYGFFEMRARLPVTDSTKSNLGIGANFWLFNSAPFCSGCTTCYSEIDIVEFVNGANPNMSGYLSSLGITNPFTQSDQVRTFNSWYNSGANTPCSGSGSGAYSPDAAVNDGNFHTYAAAWYPDRIEYFRDDILVGRKTNTQNLMDQLFIMIDLNTATYTEAFDSNNSDGSVTQLPYSYDIDYVRVYKQVFACTTAVVQNSYTFPGTDNGVVKQYYEIGGPSGSSVFTSSTGSGAQTGIFSMKADNSSPNNGYIELKSGFEVQNGATFIAETTPCQ